MPSLTWDIQKPVREETAPIRGGPSNTPDHNYGALQRPCTVQQEEDRLIGDFYKRHNSVAGDKPADTGDEKLGTFSGVFMPTTLNVLSILMFLRFGFILGQVGILGMFALLVLSYAIDLLTTLSISAIATNGTVRGGGAYYMISRSLGPEFGGAIGVVFFFGQVLNAGLNVAGFCQPILSSFGQNAGGFFPEGYWYEFFYATGVLLFCTSICMFGSGLFSQAGKVLFVILIVATVSVPLSVFFVKPFLVTKLDIWYMGPSWDVFSDNLLPRFTTGAVGSDLPPGQMETFTSLFGVFFPATAGIFAGASMSGDLKRPSYSIPKGTLSGLGLTFILYAATILGMGVAIPRALLYKDISVIETVNLSKWLILFGEMSTSLFSSMVGVIGAAYVLQAIAKDALVPYTSFLASEINGLPIPAVFTTYILTQLTLFFPLNRLATFITMAYLMTFVVTNLACFLLKIASAPNFRPSFKYFSSTTAFLGAVSCIASMFIADGWASIGAIVILAFLFILIHYVSPPKPWGDVSQALLYHQVRKYLLRLRQDHVKFWRPQILLLVDDPRSAWGLIKFCNYLKKGGLYILGHVVITKDFQETFKEVKKQQQSWTKLRDMTGAKAFVQIACSPDVVWGARNVFLGSGLGGMKPNITILGSLRDKSQPLDLHRAQTIDMEALPTDNCRKESNIRVTQWVNIIEDIIAMQGNVAIARGFMGMELPGKNIKTTQKYIDLYPIQMSAQVVDENGTSTMTTNFDTYTLILQMGAILRTVPLWKERYTLRVVVFVEFEDAVEEERERVSTLLDTLRIKAKILVLCLNSGNYAAYECIIKGTSNPAVESKLSEQDWWSELVEARESNKPYAFTRKMEEHKVIAIDHKRRHTFSSLSHLGASFSLRANSISSAGTFDSEGFSDYDENSSVIDDEEDEDEDDTSELEQNTSALHRHNSLFSTSRPLDRVKDKSRDDESSSGRSSPSSSTHHERHNSNKPAFTSQAIPKTKVNDNDDDEGNTVMFEHGDDPAHPNVLSFNDVPARAQHIILNDMMATLSSKEDTVVIFSTLPAPSMGTHRSERESLDFVDSLELWCQDLPPVLLLHCQTMTVTTAL
ncbi:Vacuolar membrane cation-chloride cotransporter (CCC), putative [Yarrowia lipolytica]|nr:Vacuolar membrane cation-chloride cotransporter (CCC), putative [Yarrowia lipolytica]